jgi:hypothetical protein
MMRSADEHHALAQPRGQDLADVLERVLDKGIVIAGDIRVELVGIELLGLHLRLVVCSLDRAEEVGLDWWRNEWFPRSKQPRRDALPMPESGRTKRRTKGKQHAPPEAMHGRSPKKASGRAGKRRRRRATPSGGGL